MKQTIIILSWIFLLLACQNKKESDTTSSSNDPTTNSTSASIPNEAPQKRIVFFGNSLTAAYNLDPEQGFALLTQGKIDSAGLNYKVINAGLSGETSAGGLQRIDWILEQQIDVFVLELGANDGLRGLNLDNTYENLKGILLKVQSKYPAAKLVIAGMQAPPNMGGAFTEKFSAIFPRLAKEFDAALIPFLLEDVGGIPALNLADGIHPNVEGHKIVANTVWETLEKEL